MKLMIEVRPGEGGDDAKLLVTDQLAIYISYAKRNDINIEIVDDSRSWLIAVVDGADAPVRRLLSEAGGHRWQRIPPTERSGRVHTSTVTVAVFPVKANDAKTGLRDRDIDVFTTKDSGPGGQHRNKTESAVIMRHKPTGIEAKSATKCQHRNRAMARAILEARVSAHYKSKEQAEEADRRRSMVGSGMRGDKVRTYRVRDDQVTDHRSNKKVRLSEIISGKLEIVS